MFFCNFLLGPGCTPHRLTPPVDVAWLALLPATRCPHRPAHALTTRGAQFSLLPSALPARNVQATPSSLRCTQDVGFPVVGYEYLSSALPDDSKLFSKSSNVWPTARHEFWVVPVLTSPGHRRRSQLVLETTQGGRASSPMLVDYSFPLLGKPVQPLPHPSHSKEPSTVHWGTKRPRFYVDSAQSPKGGRPTHSWVLVCQAGTPSRLTAKHLVTPFVPAIIIP